MSVQAYTDNTKAKTGKTPKDFHKLAKKSLMKRREIVVRLVGKNKRRVQ